MILWELFFVFAKIGLFTFGGGYAMIPLMEDSCVNQKHWITHEDMMNITVVAESTPGPIAINCATFVGCRQAGLPGAITATLGSILPSFLVVFAISTFLENFLEIAIIAKAFRGIRIAVGILILNAAVNMLKKTKKTPMAVCIILFAAAAMAAITIFGLQISSVVLMLAAGSFSLAMFLLNKEGEAA